MPRDTSGNYTLPTGNPVVTGTTIASSWANTTMTDIANTLTNSLDRYGNGSMQAALKVLDGTVGAPGIAFGSEPTTGIYRSGSDTFNIGIAGVQYMAMTQTYSQFNNPVYGTYDNGNFEARSATSPLMLWDVTGNGVDAKQWRAYAAGSSWLLQTVNDAYTIADTVFQIVRSGVTVTQMIYGNSGDNPSHGIYGSLLNINCATINASGNLSVYGSGNGFYLDSTTGNEIYVTPYGSGGVVQQVFHWDTSNNLNVIAPQTGTPTGGNTYFYRGALALTLSIGANGTVQVSAPNTGNYGLIVDGDGTVHSTWIQDASGSGIYAAGYLESPLVTLSGTHTTVQSDSAKTFLATGAGGQTFTIAAQASVATRNGTMYRIVNYSTGNVTISINSDTLCWLPNNLTGTRTLGAYGAATIQFIGGTTWAINGFNLS